MVDYRPKNIRYLVIKHGFGKKLFDYFDSNPNFEFETLNFIGSFYVASSVKFDDNFRLFIESRLFSLIDDVEEYDSIINEIYATSQTNEMGGITILSSRRSNEFITLNDIGNALVSLNDIIFCGDVDIFNSDQVKMSYPSLYGSLVEIKIDPFKENLGCIQ